MQTSSEYGRSALIFWNSAQYTAAVQFPCTIFCNFSYAISSVLTSPNACPMLTFNMSYVICSLPWWVTSGSSECQATPLNRALVYPIFFSSSSNLSPSVRNLSSQWARNGCSLTCSPLNGSGSLSFGWLLLGWSLAPRISRNISVVRRWGPAPPVPDPSLILWVCSGDSGLCSLDCGSRVTGLGALWSSGTSASSLRKRGSLVFSSWDSTASFAATSGVDRGDTI